MGISYAMMVLFYFFCVSNETSWEFVVTTGHNMSQPKHVSFDWMAPSFNLGKRQARVSKPEPRITSWAMGGSLTSWSTQWDPWGMCWGTVQLKTPKKDPRGNFPGELVHPNCSYKTPVPCCFKLQNEISGSVDTILQNTKAKINVTNFN